MPGGQSLGRGRSGQVAPRTTSFRRSNAMAQGLSLGHGQNGYSHSIVDGGFEVMSSTTRFTAGTSLTIRDEIVSSKS